MTATYVFRPRGDGVARRAGGELGEGCGINSERGMKL